MRRRGVGLARGVAIAALVTTVTAVAAAPAGAQDVLLPSTSWGFVPVIAAWHFSTPIPQSAGAVGDVVQAAVPFRVRFGLGSSWSVDLTGAYAVSGVHLAASDTSGDRVHLLSGPTDLKLRATGPIHGDALQMTIGVNVPTGLTKLSNDQTTVLEAAAAPALHMPVGAYGTGLGGTLGLISAMERGDWAFAFGASVEQRTEYTPIALALGSGTANTQVTPGTALHLSIGADRTLGEGRLGLLLLGDLYTKDQIAIGGSGAAATATSYTLGPQISAIARIDFGASAWRESGVSLGVRYRAAYTDDTGAKVAGSDATYLEGSIGGVLGHAEGTGLILSADARWQSGMTFTQELVGAATTAVGVTIGVESGGGGFRFALHPQYGTFSTGTAKSSGFGGMISWSWGARRASQ